jgi:TonB-linked SusC/RagA family outer membrane protein
MRIINCSGWVCRVVFGVIYIIGYMVSANAQVTVEGLVRLEGETQGAIGVNIVSKNDANLGTITDVDGRFSITIPNESSVLVFSYVGYETREVTPGSSRKLDIILSPSASSLSEVVITGYTTQQRAAISGSVSTIATKDLKERPVLRVEQALQGQAAGIQVAQQSGSPGSPLTVRIRGIGTINNSDPLYIVDGIPVDGLDFLNPGDIENIQILKDAASAAVYGSRGANGVVLITTKGGKKGQQGTITYEAYQGYQRAYRLLDLLDATEYATLQNEAYVAAGKVPLPEFAVPSALGKGTDWQEAIFETAPITSHQLTIAGGGDQAQHTLSANYFRQDGIVGGEKSGFRRATVRLNSSYEIKPWLTVGHNAGFTWLRRNGLPENNPYNSPLIRALNMDPVTPVRKQDGTFAYSNYADTDIANPVNGIAQTFDTWTSNRLVGNAYAEIRPFTGFSLRSVYSTDITYGVQRVFRPRYDLSNIPEISEAPAAEKNLVNSVSIGNNTWKNQQIENVITYSKKAGDVHDITMVAGNTIIKNRFDVNGGANTNLPSNNVKDAFISNTIDPISSQSAYHFASESSLLSYFSKVNYGLKDRYFASATLRADGSSRFGKNNRFGYFPSASLGWMISRESFFKAENVDFVKLRASWGQNGNDRIGDYSFTTIVYNGQNYTFGNQEVITNGSVALSAANPDLKWETSTQFNVGADAEMWGGKWNATVDYYRKNTSDMLYAAPIPLTAGTAPPVQNVASALNTGLEVSMGHRHSIKGVQYSVSLNAAWITSQVTGLGRGGEPIFSGYVQSANAFAGRTDVGSAVGAFYGYVTDGIFQTQAEVEAHAFQSEGTAPGDIRFKDLDGNKIIDLNDRTYIGNPTPDITYGGTFTASYRGFEWLVMFQGTQGNDIYNSTTRFDFAYVNRPSYVLERWTGPGTSDAEPRVNLSDPNQNARISDRFVEDGSYFRLKTCTFGYQFTDKQLKFLQVKKLKIYASAQNLWTLTNYRGLDPEIGNVGGSLEIGIDRGFYPQARTFMGGISLTF